MEIIATLVDMIDDEANGAKEYACWANKLKATNPELAKTFYELSTVETPCLLGAAVCCWALSDAG